MSSDQYSFKAFSLLFPDSGLKANFKTEDSDFKVDELMPVVPSGTGEHVWLKVRKQGSNTDYVAQQLASFAGIKSNAVSYAGLKDRHAVTTQWFSLHMPGMADPDWSQLSSNEFEVLQYSRHDRKLKKGTLSGNQFTIVLRDILGSKADWYSRLEMIQQTGVPNYFGPQRFGHDMNNLVRAADVVQANKLRRLKPHIRGMLISSMRSWLFNSIISARIKQDMTGPLQGDVFMLTRSNACFTEDLNEEIDDRYQHGEISPTAALWGRGHSMASGHVVELENQIADANPVFKDALEHAGLKQERRMIRLLPRNMDWRLEDDSLQLSFELPKGTYATALLRELCDYDDLSLSGDGGR